MAVLPVNALASLIAYDRLPPAAPVHHELRRTFAIYAELRWGFSCKVVRSSGAAAMNKACSQTYEVDSFSST